MKLIRCKVPHQFASILLMALLSCETTTISVGHLAKLRMGMNPNEPPALMKVDPKKVFQWTMPETGDSVVVQSYLLRSGDYHSTYFIAYRNDSLIFWGYPHQFARSSDPVINAKVTITEKVRDVRIVVAHGCPREFLLIFRNAVPEFEIHEHV